jgi:hypothetical protein
LVTPAVSAGAGGVEAFTVIYTVAGELVAPLSSSTVRENFNVVSDDTLGAVNVGEGTLTSLSVTAGPSICP